MTDALYQGKDSRRWAVIDPFVRLLRSWMAGFERMNSFEFKVERKLVMMQ